MNHTPGRHDPASDLNLNDFRCWLTQRNRAENTILAYTYAVQQFFSLYQQAVQVFSSGALQAQDGQPEDPGSQLLYGIHKLPGSPCGHAEDAAEHLCGKRDQPG